jgi:hypothetical protein
MWTILSEHGISWRIQGSFEGDTGICDEGEVPVDGATKDEVDFLFRSDVSTC